VNPEKIVPSPNDPMAVARAFVGETYVSDGGVLLLRHHRNAFYRYAGDHWPEDDERRVASELWRWLEDAAYWKETKDGPKLAPLRADEVQDRQRRRGVEGGRPHRAGG
jgi:hypothetical protein